MRLFGYEIRRTTNNVEPLPTPQVQQNTVFVFGGGGGKGAAQVGMLLALIEKEIRPDLIIGVSVGALNGAVFASNPTTEGVLELKSLWSELNKETVFPKRKLGTTWRYAQRIESVFPADGLRSLIRHHLSLDDIANTEIPIQILAANYITGQEEWFSNGRPEDVLYASAAIPGVLPPLRLDGKLLVDGGIVNDTPVDRAIHLGATKIYVLLCGTPYALLPPPRRPLEALIRSVTHTKAAQFRQQISSVPQNIELTVLDSPEASGLEALDFSKKDLLLETGYERAVSILEGKVRPSFDSPEQTKEDMELPKDEILQEIEQTEYSCSKRSN